MKDYSDGWGDALRYIVYCLQVGQAPLDFESLGYREAQSLVAALKKLTYYQATGYRHNATTALAELSTHQSVSLDRSLEQPEEP